MPGDNVEMVCDLVFDVALEVGTRFTLREGNKTSKSLGRSLICRSNDSASVGTGIVTKVLESV
jgi:elongation factor Tu